jgi:hypothetical protein
MSSYLVIGGWSGRRKIPVNLVGETPEAFRIEVLERIFLPGRGVLDRGQVALVPKVLIELPNSMPTETPAAAAS